MGRALSILVGVLGLHALLKFLVFFAPYARRRAALDRSYGDKTSATRVADMVLVGICVAVSTLLLWRGVDATGFLGGLWVGATLIQVYFHRFHAPLPPDRAPPPAVSPIKMMSYAIQDSPWRAAREVTVLAAVIVASLGLIWKHLG